MEPNSFKELSIQISLSGLSFCILNRSDASIEYLERFDFKTTLSPEAVCTKLQNVISDHNQLQQSFEKVLVIFQNELSSLVPENYFDPENAADYLKFSSKIIKMDFISYDKIEANNSINVFVPYININNFLFDTYGEFEYKHASTIFIEHLLATEKSSEEDSVYINVEAFHFEMAVIKKGKLQLYNTFEYFTKEDFLYFLLFTMEQLKLNPETVKVKLTGQITKDDPIYELLYTYVRYVVFDTTSQYKETSQRNTTKHRHALILNSFN